MTARTSYWNDSFFHRALTMVGGLCLAMWLVETADWLGGRWIEPDGLGIRPRSWSGLSGLFFAPFLHGSWSHLIANTVPFLVLGTLVLTHGTREFWRVTLLVAVVGGLGVWLTGKSGTNHLGASGLIFGYFGYLLANGWRLRSFTAILKAVAALVLYGSLVWGVWPGEAGVSWQGHLFGLLVGILCAVRGTRK
jgi:membrane associated rhomboid family serine protease